MHHYWSSLHCQTHPLPFPFFFFPQLKPGLHDFKSSSVSLPLQDAELLCSIKTVLHFFFFSWLPAVLPVRSQKRFWFLALCHSNIDSIFWFSFSWCFCGTFSWIYKLGWQFVEVTGAKFAHVITPITCAIMWTMCTGEQFNFSWSSVGAFLHKQFWKCKLSNEAYFCG